MVWDNKGVRICLNDFKAIILKAAEKLRLLREPLKNSEMTILAPKLWLQSLWMEGVGILPLLLLMLSASFIWASSASSVLFLFLFSVFPHIAARTSFHIGVAGAVLVFGRVHGTYRILPEDPLLFLVVPHLLVALFLALALSPWSLPLRSDAFIVEALLFHVPLSRNVVGSVQSPIEDSLGLLMLHALLPCCLPVPPFRSYLCSHQLAHSISPENSTVLRQRSIHRSRSVFGYETS